MMRIKRQLISQGYFGVLERRGPLTAKDFIFYSNASRMNNRLKEYRPCLPRGRGAFCVD